MGLSSITAIPGIMRAQSPPMTNGAALMGRWFNAAPAVAPAYGPADTTTIKMQWVLGFARAKAVYDDIVTGRLWQNPKARERVREVFTHHNLLRPNCFSFAGKDAVGLEAVYANTRPVLSPLASTPLDDLFAALANFQMRVAILGGEVAAGTAPNRFEVKVQDVGVYVVDSYDFNDDPGDWRKPSTWVSQPLGTWDDAANTVSKGSGVTNESFRDWRAANGKGGDFKVYSDVYSVPSLAAHTFEV